VAAFANTDNPLINGEDIIWLESNMKKLFNVGIEVDLTEREVVLRDLNSTDDILRPMINKLMIIKYICQKLGIKNTLDRTTIISDSVFKDNIEEWQKKHADFQIAF